MLFVCHPQILRKHCLQFLLGVKMALRGTENNSYTKFCGDKQRALWYVMVFSGVVNWSVSWKMIPYSRPKLSDLYTPSQSKLLENHTFYSGIYPYNPYMVVPPPRELAHLRQKTKDYRSWLVRGLLWERFRVRFPGVISNRCLDFFPFRVV